MRYSQWNDEGKERKMWMVGAPEAAEPQLYAAHRQTSVFVFYFVETMTASAGKAGISRTRSVAGARPSQAHRGLIVQYLKRRRRGWPA